MGLALLLICLATVLVYRAGLQGPFLFDDGPNITQNSAVQIDALSWNKLAAAAASYGGESFKRAISMTSFALNYYFTGLDSFGFKVTNLLIHLLNGLALFLLVRRILSALMQRRAIAMSALHANWISLAVCAAWLLHPINLTSVLYVVQRMTSLAAFFSLWGMVLYVSGRIKMNEGMPLRGGALIFAGLIGGTLLAMQAKENGVLLPLFLWIIEWIIFRFKTTSPGARHFLYLLFGLCVGLPAMIASIYIASHWDWITNSYTSRTFTLEERILTETRVIWFYIKLILLPTPGEFSIFHDDIALSAGLLRPWTTLPALGGIVALMVAAVWIRRKAPVFSLGILLYFAGHSIESSLIGLEIVHEHRNYLPGTGILLIIFYYLMILSKRIGRVVAGNAISALVIGLITLSTVIRADNWSNLVDLAHFNAYFHPDSSRTQYQLGLINLILMEKTQVNPQQYREKAWDSFRRSAELNATHAMGGQLAMLYMAGKQNDLLARVHLEKLLQDLREVPITHLGVANVVNLFECVSAKECQLPDELMDSQLRSILANTTLSNKNRAKILAAAAEYALNYQGLSTAIKYAGEALAANPKEPQHYLNLAMLLNYDGDLQQARRLLKRVETMDRFKAFETERLNLETKLNDKNGATGENGNKQERLE
ncbi:MAG: hypothetical protein GY941_08720 [Planctomycetes bacterium]|nr:hypothetical protein [Planctomycetota bacterium]